jgi:hypothetical protein
VSIEDRVRAATRARTGLVRDIRPLEFPGELPARARHARRTGRWLSWGAPVAAAALVTAVALILVMLRQTGAPQPAPASPAGAPPAAASVPRYYAALTGPNGTSSALSSARQQVVVVDDRTGRALAVIPPLPGQGFSGVTAAADDRTFVLSSYDSAKRVTTWYLLRITPGAARTTQLQKLDIKPLSAQLTGLALSPDGRELAIMSTGADIALQAYSVSSGALLGSWDTTASYWIPRVTGTNEYALSWSADGRQVSFRFDAFAPNSDSHLVTVRTLDVAAAGHDLLTDSRLVLQAPLGVTQPTSEEPCATSLVTPDGGTVVCGTGVLAGAQYQAPCVASPPAFVSYSTATGRPLQDLARYPGSCPSGTAVPEWTDPSARHVIGLITTQPNGKKPGAYAFGVFTGGRLTPLPLLAGTINLANTSVLTSPGSVAF